MPTHSILGGLLIALLVLGTAPQVAAQQEITLLAAPTTVQISPGVTVSAWTYNGQTPGPTLRGVVGETLRVTLINNLPEETTIHWHGLPVPNGMDGVPGVSRPPVQPGQEFTYEITLTHPGTYFYHPHVGHQLDRGLHGALIVDPIAPGDPPYTKELVVDLDDWLPGAPIPGATPVYSDYLMNGATSAGQTPFVVQQNDVVRVRFINASEATNYVVTIDGHPMTVTHTDGRRVQPVVVDGIPIGAGERYDVYITANNPGTWSIAASNLTNPGVTLVRGIMSYAGVPLVTPPANYAPPGLTSPNQLDYSMLASAEPPQPLATTPDKFFNQALSWQPFTNTWFMGGQAWPNITPLQVTFGDEVRVTMSNMTPIAHPMHLHGHFFRLHGTGGGTANPVLKDTVLIKSPLMGGPGSGIPSATFDFLADNPGRWMFHCHNIYHALTGMMTIIQYTGGDQDGDGLDDGLDLDALDPYPALTTNDLGGSFLPGNTFQLEMQWPPGSTAAFYVGVELPAPVSFLPAGWVRITNPYLLGLSVAGADSLATLPIALPADPSLSGIRAVFQGAATSSLAPGFRISTSTVVTVN